MIVSKADYINNYLKKVILITGASSGIGKVCANYLCQKGYRVFGTSRHTKYQMLKEPENNQSGTLEMIQMDVNNDLSVKQAIDFILNKEGRLDVVVNNAGFGIVGAIEDTSISEAKSQFETKFFGILRICRSALPIMRKQKFGYIINISSIGGIIGLPYQGLYSASKFAVDGLTEALRMEVKQFGINVVLIEPGDFHTQFTSNRHKTFQSQKNKIYAEHFNSALEVIEEDEKKVNSPDIIAHLLEHIIKNPSPRLRYKVGPVSEKIAIILKRIIPGWLFEWILMKHYKLI